MDNRRWTDLGLTEEQAQAAQARAERQRELQGLTVQEIDRELRDASDARLDRLASYAPDLRNGQSWDALDEDERRGQRAVNELANRRRRAEQQQARQAEEAKRQAQRDAAASAEIAAFEAQARQAFPGTAAEFDKVWPQLRAAWQQRETLRRIDEAEQRLRARGAL